MNKLEIQELINKLQDVAKNFDSEVELQVLDKCPFIIEVGFLTVTTNAKGVVTTSNTTNPGQFTNEAVKEILSMNWYNGINEKVVPVVYGRNEWYKKRLEQTEKSIDDLNQTLTLFN
jgi:hypothetical protein